MAERKIERMVSHFSRRLPIALLHSIVGGKLGVRKVIQLEQHRSKANGRAGNRVPAPCTSIAWGNLV